MHEIGDRVVGQARQHAGREAERDGMADRQRRAVRRAPRDRVGRDRAGGAGAVLHDHGGTDRLAERAGDEAGDHVGQAAGREARHEADAARALGQGGGDQGGAREGGGDQAGGGQQQAAAVHHRWRLPGGSRGRPAHGGGIPPGAGPGSAGA
jgi:hypothetical protein